MQYYPHEVSFLPSPESDVVAGHPFRCVLTLTNTNEDESGRACVYRVRLMKQDRYAIKHSKGTLPAGQSAVCTIYLRTDAAVTRSGELRKDKFMLEYAMVEDEDDHVSDVHTYISNHKATQVILHNIGIVGNNNNNNNTVTPSPLRTTNQTTPSTSYYPQGNLSVCTGTPGSSSFYQHDVTCNFSAALTMVELEEYACRMQVQSDAAEARSEMVFGFGRGAIRAGVMLRRVCTHELENVAALGGVLDAKLQSGLTREMKDALMNINPNLSY
eukprot:PhM_4_TR13051/c0_g1_i1/m.15216